MKQKLAFHLMLSREDGVPLVLSQANARELVRVCNRSQNRKLREFGEFIKQAADQIPEGHDLIMAPQLHPDEPDNVDLVAKTGKSWLNRAHPKSDRWVLQYFKFLEKLRGLEDFVLNRGEFQEVLWGATIVFVLAPPSEQANARQIADYVAGAFDGNATHFRIRPSLMAGGQVGES
jgi:hypothetical protein